MKLFIILFLLPIQVYSQDISGLWSGYLYNDTTRKYLPYELTVSENKDRSNGYSHVIILIDGIENIGIKTVQIKKRNGKIFVEDEAYIYNNFIEAPPKGVRVFSKMIYKEEDGVLSGEWNTNSTKEYSALKGSIRLQKQKDLTHSKLIARLDEFNLSNTVSFLSVKKEKEVLAIVSNAAQVKKSEPVSIRKEEIKDIPITAPVKEVPPVLKPELIEVASISSKSSIQKQKPIFQPKEKEKPVIKASPPEVVKKLPPVSSPKPKEKQIVVVTSAPTIKKQQPVSPQQPDKKEVVISLPPAPAKPIIVVPVIASAADLTKRKTEAIRSVLFKSDSLLLSLYDNGEIDGDTVTVVLNGKVIMARQGLSTNAITKTIYLTPDLGDSLQLIMYAENLGSIPPNSGLLILQDGNERHEIRFAGDFQKNSAITLRRKR